MSEFDQTDERAIDARLRRHGEALRRPSATGARTRNCCSPAGPRCSTRRCATGWRRMSPRAPRAGVWPRTSTASAFAEPDAAVEQRVLARVTGPHGTGRVGPAVAGGGVAAGVGAGRDVVVFAHRVAPPRGRPPRPGPEPAPLAVAPVVALWTHCARASARALVVAWRATRGSGTARRPDGVALVAALAPYQSGDYADAIARLAAGRERLPGVGRGALLPGRVSTDGGSSRRRPWHRSTGPSRCCPRRANPKPSGIGRRRSSGRASPSRARARLRALCAQPGELPGAGLRGRGVTEVTSVGVRQPSSGGGRDRAGRVPRPRTARRLAGRAPSCHCSGHRAASRPRSIARSPFSIAANSPPPTGRFQRCSRRPTCRRQSGPRRCGAWARRCSS